MAATCLVGGSGGADDAIVSAYGHGGWCITNGAVGDLWAEVEFGWVACAWATNIDDGVTFARAVGGIPWASVSDGIEAEGLIFAVDWLASAIVGVCVDSEAAVL